MIIHGRTAGIFVARGIAFEPDDRDLVFAGDIIDVFRLGGEYHVQALDPGEVACPDPKQHHLLALKDRRPFLCFPVKLEDFFFLRHEIFFRRKDRRDGTERNLAAFSDRREREIFLSPGRRGHHQVVMREFCNKIIKITFRQYDILIHRKLRVDSSLSVYKRIEAL